MRTALDSIASTLAALQDGSGVAADQRITVQLGPGDPAFTYEHGSTTRATLATILLGLILTFSVPVVYERFLRRHPGSPEQNRRTERQFAGSI